MNRISLEAEVRSGHGKGPARRLRTGGKVPAVFYGKKTAPLHLVVDAHQFGKEMDKAGTNPLFDLNIAGPGEKSTRQAILKARQIRPVDGGVLHLDFLEVFLDEAIEVAVPIEYEGKPVGIDKGGEFHVAMRELRVACLPDDIPSVITVDVSGLDVGHSVHVGGITLPKGVTAIQDSTVALATVAAPKKPDEEAAAAPIPEAAPEPAKKG